jgi:hypothetical protein
MNSSPPPHFTCLNRAIYHIAHITPNKPFIHEKELILYILSHPLNVNRPILLMNHPIIRPITLLNLPPNLRILLHIDLRSRQLCRQLISTNDNRRVRLEEAVDIFEGAVGSFGIEEVGYRDEGEADAGLFRFALELKGEGVMFMGIRSAGK